MAIFETYDVSYRIKGWFDPLADVAGWYDFDLVSPSGPPALTGGAIGTSADAATLEAQRKIAGAATGTGTDAATLEARRAITGAATGTSADAAQISAKRAITGAATGSSADAATLRGGSTPAVTGAATGSSADTAAIEAQRRVTGAATGPSADAGVLEARRAITGGATGSSASSATLSGASAPPTPPAPAPSTGGGSGEFVQDRQPRRLARGRAQRFKYPNDARRTIPQLSSSELDESAAITWGDVVHAESAWFADAPDAWHGLLYAEVEA